MDHPTAGARVRMTFEGIVQYTYQPGRITLGDGTTVGFDPDRYTPVVLAGGWEPGDVVDTPHGRLTRHRDPEGGYEFWKRGPDGVHFHDDQVDPGMITVVQRTRALVEAREDLDDEARAAAWCAVEAIITRAQEKGVTRIDTDVIAEALRLDQYAAEPDVDGFGRTPGEYRLSTAAPAAVTCRAPNSPSCACASGEYRFCGATLDREEAPHTCNRRVAHTAPCAPTMDPETPCIAAGADEGGDGSHPFNAEHLDEVSAKRRLPRCKECGGQADNELHDEDQRATTRHYRMLLRAVNGSRTRAADTSDTVSGGKSDSSDDVSNYTGRIWT